MQRLLRLLLGAFGLWLSASFGWAQTPVQPVPALTARAMDFTGTLTRTQLAALEAQLAGLEARRGTQVVVLMIQSTQPEDIFDYTQRVAETWKIGRRDVGDGLLFVIAKQDRRMRIAPARALEGAVPDVVAKRLIDNVVAPAFRRGDFAGGISQALVELTARIEGESLPTPEPGAAPRAVSTSGIDWPLALLVFLPFASRVLRAVVGRGPGALLLGLTGAGVAWWLTREFWIAMVVGLLALLASLFLTTLRSGGLVSSGSRSRGGWTPSPGGHWGQSGSRGGGGFRSGGGGSFGGGGASGGW